MKNDQKSTIKSFTPQFKENAVRIAKEMGNISATARQLNISPSLLRSWLFVQEKARLRGGGLAFALPDKEKMVKMERDLVALRVENAILKKRRRSSHREA